MSIEGQALVRIAQLRRRIALFARGGRYDLAASLLGELIRADLGLALPADALLRARQAAALASTRSEPLAGPLVVLAATLLASGAFREAGEAAVAAVLRASAGERARVEVIANLIGGAVHRRSARFAEARALLDAARGAAARIGAHDLAGFALVELAWVELGDGQPAAAATCFEFAATFLRDRSEGASLEADALSVAAWAAADDLVRARERATDVTLGAQRARRDELVAYMDSALADAALRVAPATAATACEAAVRSAQRLSGALARDLVVQARLRQVRASHDARDRARMLEVGIELAVALDRDRATTRLGSFLIDLLDDAALAATTVARTEAASVTAAIDIVGDVELSEMAHAVLAELG